MIAPVSTIDVYKRQAVHNDARADLCLLHNYSILSLWSYIFYHNGESAAVNACYNIGYVGDAAGSGSAGGVIGLNKNTSPSAARVQNIYTLAEAALNKNAVGAGTVSGVQDEPVTKDALIAARIGTAFTADAVPVSGTYLYPYPYLRGAPHGKIRRCPTA